MKKKILSVFILLLLTFLTLLTYNENAQFELLIDSPVLTEKVILQERNKGFKGAQLKYIIENPKNPNEVIAKGTAGNYYSNDKGDSWRLLEIFDKKYAGGIGGHNPNVYWEKSGLMVTTSSGGFSWSDNTVDWNSKGGYHNMRRCGINRDGKIWLERAVKGQDKNVFEYIDFSKPKEPSSKIISAGFEIFQIQQEDEFYLKNNTDKWKIENNLVFYRPDTTSSWIAKNNGIERPIILYFLQDAKTPEKIVAVEGVDVLYSQRHFPNPIFAYWSSEDFGQNWSKTDSSILTKWNLEKIHDKPSSCHLYHKNFDGYLNAKEIETNFSFFGLVIKTGWLGQNQFYLLGGEGIQFGDVGENCTLKNQTLWSWNYSNWETDTRYNVASFENYITYDLDFKKKEHDRIVFLKKDGKIKFIFPGSYGGLWYAEVPQGHPFSPRRFLYYFVHHQLVLSLYLIVAAFFFYNRRKNKQ